jgi:hypothetical protein
MDDQVGFWLPALLGTAAIEVAVQEWLARKYAGAISFFAVALVLFASALFSAVTSWTDFVEALHKPPLILYIPVSIVLMVALPFLLETRKDSALRERSI